jgi:hypothetical protein
MPISLACLGWLVGWLVGWLFLTNNDSNDRYKSATNHHPSTHQRRSSTIGAAAALHTHEHHNVYLHPFSRWLVGWLVGWFLAIILCYKRLSLPVHHSDHEGFKVLAQRPNLGTDNPSVYHWGTVPSTKSCWFRQGIGIPYSKLYLRDVQLHNDTASST